MTSPAERYAAFRRQQQALPQALREFASGYPFPLDPFQIDACLALEAGNGVLVAAPTGSGKTVVGEFAVHLALRMGQKCFYTTPIKALSNQKYGDLLQRYGERRVGLLTGDNTINGEADVVVMTTEVLRNMLYAGSQTLRGLGYVVMDEVHYLADRFRGAVWEEVIIHLPDAVRLVSLSATVSNAEEFADWLITVRGHTKVVVEERRPVPLWQHVMVGRRLYDLFVEAGPDSGADVGGEAGGREGERRRVNPALLRLARQEDRVERLVDRRAGRAVARPRRYWPPSRVDVIERLDREGLLPAITFIFSRNGCDVAVRQCLAANLRLNSAAEAAEVARIVGERTKHLPDEDLEVLGYSEFAEALTRGLAAHHAGMLPTFKEVVEELFAAGLVKAVFATETLALGINMPARSVVLEKLTKWNGETHADVTPGEYTQLTGRAGRRGIDVEGHAIVLYAPGLDPLALAGLASTRTYPLRSSFRPSYNMAVNVVREFGRERARTLLESSFAQFQADRAVVGLARQLKRNEEALEGYREAMRCHLGDFEQYARLRRDLSDREAVLARETAAARKAAAVTSLERLKPGDVIAVPGGRRAGLAIVLDAGAGIGLDPRPVVVTEERQVRRLSVVDFPTAVEPLAKVRIPKGFNARVPQHRRDLASSLRNLRLEHSGERPRRARSSAGDDAELARLRAALRQHPCHGCADREEHARWAERFWRLRRDTDALGRRVESRTNTIARMFDRVCQVLDALGYLDGDTVPESGRRLARLYTELDLLAAEALRRGLWDGLSAPELAAVVSALVFEARQPDDRGASPQLPGGRTRDVLGRTVRLWGELDALESEHRLAFLREPDLGFAWAAHAWASGASLDAVLSGTDLPPGDFVRWIKQLIDLLGQIADAADDPVRAAASAAVQALRRGVVSYSSVG